LLTLNALCAADYVLISLQCEYLALEGLAQLKGTVDRVRQHLNHRLAMIGVVTTMYDGRTNLAQQVLEEVHRYFPNHIFEGSVPRSIRVGEAPSYGKLLVEYDPQSRASAAYTALASEGGTPMAPDQYSTLLDVLQMVPDPRKARGKRYSWTSLLTIIVAGLASNYTGAVLSPGCGGYLRRAMVKRSAFCSRMRRLGGWPVPCVASSPASGRSTLSLPSRHCRTRTIR
jgi:hypothetical protein